MNRNAQERSCKRSANRLNHRRQPFLRDWRPTRAAAADVEVGVEGRQRLARGIFVFAQARTASPDVRTAAEGALAVLARPQWQGASCCPNSPSGSMAAQQPARQVPSLNRSVRLSCQAGEAGAVVEPVRASFVSSRWKTTTSARAPSPGLNSLGRAPRNPPLQTVNVSPLIL